MIAATAQLKRLQSSQTGGAAARPASCRTVEWRLSPFSATCSTDISAAMGTGLDSAARLQLPTPNSAVRSRVKVTAGNDLNGATRCYKQSN